MPGESGVAYEQHQSHEYNPESNVARSTVDGAIDITSLDETISNVICHHTHAECGCPDDAIKVNSSSNNNRSRRNSTQAAAQYLDYVKQLKSVWSDMPVIDVTYSNLNYTIPIPVGSTDIPSLHGAFMDTLLYPYNLFKHTSTKFDMLNALQNVDGVLKHGTMTLVLAPPGHGKTSYLRAVAGQLNNKAEFTGDIRYNGLSAKESAEIGLRVNRIAAFCGQVDSHLPTLTVRETIEFAMNNAVASLDGLPGLTDELKHLHAKRVDLIIDLLNLRECQDTIAGNDLLRGISGGQKKRLTIAEILVTNARVLCLDEITNGLDSAVAYDINLALSNWCKVSDSIIISALLQPTPETYALFDDVVLLSNGNVVYHGPRTDVIPYLNSIGVQKLDTYQDDADFIVSFLAQPNKFINRISPSQSVSHNMNNVTTQKLEQSVTEQNKLSPVPSAERIAVDSSMKVKPNTASLVSAYQRSDYYNDIQTQLSVVNKSTQAVEQSAYNKRQYGDKYSHGFVYHALSNTKRQFYVMLRDPSMWLPRLMTAIIMGLLLGGLFFGTAKSDYQDRVGLMLFVVVNSAFGNMSELPATDSAKPVLYKQMDHSFYSSSAYIIAQNICTLPIQAVEVLILSSCVYYMTNFESDPGRFFFFVLCVYITNIAIAVLFRSIAYSVNNQFIAQQIDGPLIGIMMIFGGFLITRLSIPIWLIEFYYISPFSWIVRSMAQNEYEGVDYNDIYPNTSESTGTFYLHQWEMQSDPIWKWLGILYMGFVFIFFYIINIIALSTQRFELSLGTKRSLNEDDFNGVALDVEQVSTANALPFVPVTVVWKDISYTVPIKGEEDRRLLTKINGYCKPGEMTALMGSSGAGKTTLMDVIAGRKTAGTMEGEILLNGHLKKDKSFAQMVGYCEQNDLHMGFHTVREAFLFSAKLRLPVSVNDESRIAFVDELIDLLEMTELKDRIIGDESFAGLSPAQKKLVTIGVELSANPSVIFLDEPTSGLDARSALVVMQAVKRIAITGRTILCTIHQPSAEVFYLFDRLLLLKSGGVETYLGPVGNNGSSIVQYFESASPESNYKFPKTVNPATYMLDVIADKSIDFADIYANSQVKKQNIQTIEQLSMPTVERQRSFMTEEKRPGFVVQYIEVQKRQFLTYYRNTPFNYTRLYTQLLLGILYGLVYLQLSVNTFGGVRSLLGGVFMTLGFGGIINCSVVMPVIAAERAVFYRERSSNTYSSWAYSWSLTVVEMPYIALGTFLYVVPFYFMIGFDSNGVVFFQYWLMQFLFGIWAASVGHFLAAALPDIISATQVQGLFFTLSFLFAGVFIAPTSLPAGWLWIYTINPYPKALNSMILTQTVHNYNVVQGATVHDLVSETLSAGYDTYGTNIGWLFLEIVVFRLFAVLAFRYISHIKR